MNSKDLIKSMNTEIRSDIVAVMRALHREGRHEEAKEYSSKLIDSSFKIGFIKSLYSEMNKNGYSREFISFVVLENTTFTRKPLQGSFEDLQEIFWRIDDIEVLREKLSLLKHLQVSSLKVVGFGWWCTMVQITQSVFGWQFYTAPRKKEKVSGLTFSNVLSHYSRASYVFLGLAYGFVQDPLKTFKDIADVPNSIGVTDYVFTAQQAIAMRRSSEKSANGKKMMDWEINPLYEKTVDTDGRTIFTAKDGE